MNTINFGVHLILDLYGCTMSKLNSSRICYKALDRLPALINMTKLIEPTVIEAKGNVADGGKDPGGQSGYIMIEESHISIHTFAKRGFATIDVYSCKEFDTNYVCNYFEEIFCSKDKEMHVIKRGKRYPKENIY